MKKTIIIIGAAIGSFFTITPLVLAQGTAFTYQGRLNDGPNPATGSYDLRFAIFNAPNAGTQQSSLLTNSATPISNGLFIVQLDFGAAVFNGNSRWLEIDVRTNGNGTFNTLLPRQAIAPAPYAIMSGDASNLLGTLPTAQLTGTFPASQLSGTPNTAVNFTGSLNGDVTGTQTAAGHQRRDDGRQLFPDRRLLGDLRRVLSRRTVAHDHPCRQPDRSGMAAIQHRLDIANQR